MSSFLFQRQNRYGSFHYSYALCGACILGIISGDPVSNADETNSKIYATRNFPVYRKEDVEAYNSKEKGVWVTYKDGVYDVTQFLTIHPGGEDKLMQGAGGAVESYWRVYQQHYNSPLVNELLASMRVGTLHPDDVPTPNDNDILDPYLSDPLLQSSLIVHSYKPLLVETPTSVLAKSWITPIEDWFLSNHHPVPQLNEEDFVLSLSTSPAPSPSSSPSSSSSTTSSSSSSSSSSSLSSGSASQSSDSEQIIPSLSLSYSQLREMFSEHTVVTTIQCGGNRRGEMNQVNSSYI